MGKHLLLSLRGNAEAIQHSLMAGLPRSLSSLAMTGLIVATILSSAPVMANPSPPYLTLHVPQAAELGRGRLTYLLWEVYDARLFTPKGSWQNKPPYALELHYLMSLDGEKIAERSAEEMRGQGFKDETLLKKWQQQMTAIFPDVEKGDTITGVLDEKGTSRFYLNQKNIGVISDPVFGEYFFGIWLNEKTSEAALRRKLLAL